jgi:hypothetical protein
VKTTKGMPISGGRLPRKTRYVLGNQAQTSSTAQRQIRQPDLPQQDPQLRIAAPTQAINRANQKFQKDALRFGGTGQANSVREMSDPNFGAVGYESGATKPKRPGTSIISGYPTRGNKRIAGDGNQPSAIKARVSGKMKTNLDIFNPRVLHEAGLTRL